MTDETPAIIAEPLSHEELTYVAALVDDNRHVPAPLVQRLLDERAAWRQMVMVERRHPVAGGGPETYADDLTEDDLALLRAFIEVDRTLPRHPGPSRVSIPLAVVARLLTKHDKMKRDVEHARKLGQFAEPAPQFPEQGKTL